MPGGNVKEIVNNILVRKGTITSGELARAAGISRQAAHRHLRGMVEQGMLDRIGRGRGAHYVRRTGVGDGGSRPVSRYVFALAGLEEDRVWDEVAGAFPSGLGDEDVEVLHYAFTEMLNNAIEHSGGRKVEISIEAGLPVAFVIADDGVGIFEKIKGAFGLDSHLDALWQLSKGKLTTKPDSHTGEGIFFVSKAASVFEIHSGSLRWMVDNVIGDQAVFEASPRPGTIVRFELLPGSGRPLERIFAEYTEDFSFTKSRIVVKLFNYGVRFVSRSEARRLLDGLEKFSEVVLDFKGVEGIGQGFADEIFRVWARAHTGTRLTPVNMNSAVEFMVNRAIAAR